MKLNESYVERLKELDNPKFQSFIADKKICYLPDNNRGMLYENITRINFNSFYTNIQIELFNEGLIGKEWKEDIERVQWFLKNRKELKLLPSSEYEKWKIFSNSLYMKIKSPYVVEYVDMFYTDLIEKYGDLIDEQDSIAQKELEDEKKIEEKQKKWAWEKLLFGIAQGDIIKINQVTQLGLVYVFNMLAMRKELGITD
jgi:hypothetical protein